MFDANIILVLPLNGIIVWCHVPALLINISARIINLKCQSLFLNAGMSGKIFFLVALKIVYTKVSVGFRWLRFLRRRFRRSSTTGWNRSNGLFGGANSSNSGGCT